MNAVAVLSKRAQRLPDLVPHHARSRPEVWLGTPWLAAFAAVAGIQFYLGVVYNSNETTNIYLRLARGSAFALLPVMAVMWLPVMRNVITVLESSRAGRLLPLEGARTAHRWLGHMLFALSLVHGSQYLVYYTTLNQPFADVVFGLQPDLVRSMRTNMYDFLTEDESIEVTERWIAAGMPREQYDKEIHPIMQKDCVKCHNTTAARSYARTDMPMTNYEEVASWAREGALSRQFRINVSGLVMLVLFAAVWVTSLAGMRRKRFNAFQHTHRLGYLLAILALLHIPSLQWVVGPAAVLFLELYLSRHRLLYRDCPARVVRLTDEIVRLEIRKPERLRLPAGHYVQLRIKEFGRQEWHAFSLTGPAEDQDTMVIKVRCAGDWTNKLMDLARDGGHELLVDVRGPYASPAAQAVHHGDWLLVGGGIGVTPFLSLLREIAVDSDRPRHIHLVWILRMPTIIRWIEPLVERFADHHHVRMHWHIYVDDPAWAGRLPTMTAASGHEIELREGRPNWDELFAGIAGTTPQLSCFTCGPHPMMMAVTSHCRRRGWPVRTEQFA